MTSLFIGNCELRQVPTAKPQSKLNRHTIETLVEMSPRAINDLYGMVFDRIWRLAWVEFEDGSSLSFEARLKRFRPQTPFQARVTFSVRM